MLFKVCSGLARTIISLPAFSFQIFKKEIVITTVEDVINFRLNDIHLSGTAIAKIVGVSKQRVAQILGPANFIPKEYLCKYCGKPMLGQLKKNHICCSNKCHSLLHSIELTCYTCGDKFRRRISYHIRKQIDPKYTTKHDFCNNQCQGKYTAKIFGFIAHPENRRNNIVGKLDPIKEEVKAAFDSGCSIKEITKLFNVGYTTARRWHVMWKKGKI